jgi:hypothetical protein
VDAVSTFSDVEDTWNVHCGKSPLFFSFFVSANDKDHRRLKAVQCVLLLAGLQLRAD